jgi:hypothetical protein
METMDPISSFDRLSQINDDIRLCLYPYTVKGTIILLGNKSPYYLFTTPRIRRSVPLKGVGWEKNFFDLVALEIVNDEKSREVILSLIVGPGEEKERQKWIGFCLKKGQPFIVGKSRNENGKRFQVVYQEILLSKNDYEGEAGAVNEILNRSLNRFVNQRLPFFERALMDGAGLK